MLTPAQDPNIRLRKDHFPLRRDLVVVALVTACVAAFAVYVELNEAMFAVTRRWEVLQVDELPITLLALTLCLAWFAWRRFLDARRELDRRRIAEARLETLLFENRRLAQEYLHVQESERKLLAHELHDELGQYLNAIKIDAVAIQQRATDEALPLLRASSAIIEHADHVHCVVRDLIGRLRPVGLDELGLRAAVEHFLDGWRRRLPQLHFDIVLEGDLDEVGEPLALTLYRLLQEGLTNISKHARARRIAVRLQRCTNSEGDEVVLSLADDGCGTEPGQHHHGLGLVGMRERVEMLGGRFQVVTGPNRGFSMLARIPAVHGLQVATS
jgi:glucose-6-phosphate-specific signal transduction histidine kinase